MTVSVWLVRRSVAKKSFLLLFLSAPKLIEAPLRVKEKAEPEVSIDTSETKTKKPCCCFSTPQNTPRSAQKGLLSFWRSAGHRAISPNYQAIKDSCTQDSFSFTFPLSIIASKLGFFLVLGSGVYFTYCTHLLSFYIANIHYFNSLTLSQHFLLDQPLLRYE